MFGLALAIGIYTYLILILGLWGKITFWPVFGVTLVFWSGLLGIVFEKKKIRVCFKKRKLSDSNLVLILVLILVAQVFLNLTGALGPELSFDALWYHLTLPKLYLCQQAVTYFPGGLLYYSVVPRLTEMLFTAALLFKNEILAKLVHWLFGLLSAVALFKLLKRFLDNKFSLLGTTTFYTFLVVGWLSTTTYVDLTRTFFEILALTFFLRWLEEKGNWLVKSGLMMGLSLSTKLLSLQSLLIFSVLIVVFSRERLKNLGQFLSVSLGVVLPWYWLAYQSTGNPLYPLFSGWFAKEQIGNWENLWRPLVFLTSPWEMTFKLDNLMTPIFLILLPQAIAKIWSQGKLIKAAALLAFLGYCCWLLTPPFTARYLLPFTPAMILVFVKILTQLKPSFQKVAIGAVILSCLLNVASRAAVTRKFLPVVLGWETKARFLSRNLNLDDGDFYDVDGFFKENIKKDDLVLIYNIHNLFYVDFPFVHESWFKPGDKITHILVKKTVLPAKYGDGELIYESSDLELKLYRL